MKGFSFFLFLVFLISCREETINEINLVNAWIGIKEIELGSNTVTTDIPVNESIILTFSNPINSTSLAGSLELTLLEGSNITISSTLFNNNKSISVSPTSELSNNTEYVLKIKNTLTGADGSKFKPVEFRFTTEFGALFISSFKVDDKLVSNARLVDVSLNPTIKFQFSTSLNTESITANNISLTGIPNSNLSFELQDENRTLLLTVAEPLNHINRYRLSLSSSIRGTNGEVFTSFTRDFYTAIDPTPKFPIISDEELLTKVQQQTFKYFWDFGHPASGMARERNTSGDLVTSGGSGFGLMSIIVGIERGFITRTQGIERIDKILDFLETADRFHGAWSHWINGNTGDVISFSANDNGGDLVETSFLVQGLITVRQYLNAGSPTENQLITRINTLYQGVEWDWYRRGDQNVMYWHWSLDKDWAMNLQVRGWNEALMVYLMAAASPTHTIPKIVYDNGWASNGNMRNGNVYEGITLPLGYPSGGPLFLSQYSFLGLDPNNLADAYCADYFNQNRNHSLINYKYCIRNPRDYVGYSSSNWGLTASDNHQGYNAHSPTNDLGVISPTAALAAFPYTPEESMEALKFFYYTMGDRLWGQYGFYDAFNMTENWYASSYLAIDQGPIIIMIENHRTGLLWDLFMSAPEVQTGLTKLGFTY
jgi:hypothetical protein